MNSGNMAEMAAGFWKLAYSAIIVFRAIDFCTIRVEPPTGKPLLQQDLTGDDEMLEVRLDRDWQSSGQFQFP
jgi:hypothetical protein